MQEKKEVLILGGGYAALSFVRNLPASCLTQARFRLITKSAQHYTSVLLHESVSMDKHIGHSYERILPAQVECIYDEVLRIEQGRVIARGGEWGYDVLVVALGFASDDFGIAGIAEYAYAMVDWEGCKNLHALICEKLQAFGGHSALSDKSAIEPHYFGDRPCVLSPRASAQSPDFSSQILECQDESLPKDSKEISESTLSDSHSISESRPLQNLESTTDSEVRAERHALSAIKSIARSADLEGVVGVGGLSRGEGATSPNSSPSPLDEKEKENLSTNGILEAKTRDSEKLESAKDSETENKAESSAQDSIKIQKAPQGKLRFVICGGGFSGIELIASLAEELPKLCARYGLKRDSVELVCVEAMAQILPMFPPALMQKALDYLNAQGVRVETNCKILEVLESGVRVEQGGEVRVIESHLTFWSAGVKGSPVIAGSEFFTSARSKVEVDSHLQPINQAKQDSMTNIFVLGDCAAFKDPSSGRFFPPTAQIAIRQGAWLASVFPSVLSGAPITQDFHFASRGTVCSLGSRFAIGLVGERHISGRLAIWIKRWIEFSWLAKLKGYLTALAKS